MPIFYPSVSGDDGFFAPESDEFNSDELFLRMGNSGGEVPRDYDSFVRFPNVTIPKDSSIETAYVRFIARFTDPSTDCNVNCYFNAVDNSIAPTTIEEAIALALTTPVAWDNIVAWQAGLPYNSPELKNIFQVIVNKAGWVDGNAAMIVFKNNASLSAARRRPFSFDALGGVNKAELHISLEAPPVPAQPSHLTLMGIGI